MGGYSFRDILIALWAWTILIPTHSLAQIVLDVNQTLYKEDVKYIDLDQFAGIASPNLGFTNWVDTKQPNPNLELDSGNPAVAVKTPEMYIPSTYRLVCSKLKRYTTNMNQMVILYKRPDNNFVVKSVSFENGILRSYVSYPMLSPTEVGVLGCTDMYIYGGNIYVLCGDFPNGNVVIKLITWMATIPVASNMPTWTNYTIKLNTASLATNPIQAAYASLRGQEVYLSNTGGTQTPTWYNIFVIYNKIPPSQYTSTGLPPALATLTTYAYLGNYYDNPQPIQTTLFDFPTLGSTGSVWAHSYVSDMFISYDFGLQQARLYMWAYSTTLSTFHLLAYPFNLLNPGTTVRPPTFVAPALFRLTSPFKNPGYFEFGYTYPTYCIGITSTAPRRAVFNEIYISFGGTDTAHSYLFSASTYKDMVPVRMGNELTYYETNGGIRYYTFIYEEIINGNIFTVSQAVLWDYSNPGPLFAGRSSILYRRGAGSSTFSGLQTNTRGEIYFLTIETSEILLFNSSIVNPGIGDRSTNVVLDPSRFTVGPPQSILLQNTNDRIVGSPVSMGYQLVFTSTNFMWRIDVPTSTNALRAEAFIGRWTRLPVDASQVNGTALQYSLVSNPSVYSGWLLKDNDISLMTADGITPISLANLNVMVFGSVVFTRERTSAPFKLTAYECKTSQTPPGPKILFTCTFKTSYLNSLGNYFKHKLFPDGFILLVNLLATQTQIQITGYRPGVGSLNSQTYIQASGGVIQDVGFYMQSSNPNVLPSYYLIVYEQVLGTPVNWVVKYFLILNDGGGLLQIFTSSTPSTTLLPGPGEILRVTSVTDVRLQASVSPPSNNSPQLWTLSLSGSNIDVDSTQTMEFRRGYDLRPAEVVKMCWFDVPNPANISQTIPHILYYYTTSGSPLAKVAKGFGNQFESYGLGIGDLGVVTIFAAFCYPDVNLFALVARKPSNTYALMVYDVSLIANPEKRLRIYSEIGGTFAVTSFLVQYDGLSAWYFSAYNTVSNLGYTKVVYEGNPTLWLNTAVPGLIYPAIRISNLNTSLTPAPLALQVSSLPWLITSSLNATLLPGSPPLPFISVPVDSVINFNSHVISTSLAMQSADQSFTIDSSLLRLVNRVTLDLALSPVRRVRRLQSVISSGSTSQESNRKLRILQGLSLSSSPSLVRVRGQYTLILYEMNSFYLGRTVIHVYNQTTTFEKTIDVLGVICKHMDFKVQTPLILHIFLQCEDKRIRYLKVSADKLNSSVLTLMDTSRYVTGSRLSVALNGDTKYESFYLSLYDEGQTTYRLFGVNTSTLNPNFTLQERLTVPYANSHSLVELPYRERYWVCAVFRDLGPLRNKNDLKTLCLDNTTKPMGTEDVSNRITDLEFLNKSNYNILGINCINTTVSSGYLLCDVSIQGSLIFELTYSIVPGPLYPNFTKLSEVSYTKHGDNFGSHVVSSNEYLACLSYSLDPMYNNILLFRRSSFQYGGPLVYYSLNSSNFSRALPADTLHMEIYKSPTDNSTSKLVVLDFTGSTLGKIYILGLMRLEISGVGFYEQLRWPNLSLNVNPNYVMQANYTLWSLFFNPNTPNKDVRDAGSWGQQFFSSLLYWLLGLLILSIILSPLVIYYIRRERLKGYTSS